LTFRRPLLHKRHHVVLAMVSFEGEKSRCDSLMG
jgi:hypothetical protein